MVDKGEKDYARVHWGERGPWGARTSVVVNPFEGRLIVLGKVEEITYSTVKGGDASLTNYVHEFEKTLPYLAFHECDNPRCPQRGKMVFAGGSYRVTERGIVG